MVNEWTIISPNRSPRGRRGRRGRRLQRGQLRIGLAQLVEAQVVALSQTFLGVPR